MEKLKQNLKTNNYNLKELLKTFPNDLIKLSEENYVSQISKIVKNIVNNKTTKFILIGGPSSSGKTTSSYIIQKKLLSYKITAKVISLDDFFLDRDQTPLLPNGDKDFDSLNSLDWTLFKTCMNKLITKKEALLPTYDFISGGKKYINEKTTLNNNELIIIEGLHALNPIINKYIPSEFLTKIYACPNSGFNFLEEEKLNTYNLRLIRRIIRDAKTRGVSPTDTLVCWKNVRAAEKKYISPFKNQADFLIDTTHAYEPFVYKTIFSKLINNNTIKLQELSKALEMFTEITPDNIPETSLLIEFVG